MVVSAAVPRRVTARLGESRALLARGRHVTVFTDRNRGLWRSG